MGHSQRCQRLYGVDTKLLIRKQTGKGFPQVPDGLGFGLVLVHGRPEEGGLCEAEGVGQGLRLAARHKHNEFCMVTPCPSLPCPSTCVTAEEGKLSLRLGKNGLSPPAVVLSHTTLHP